MNYSTIVFSLVAVLGLSGISNAQDTTSSTSMSSSAKVFGGRSQYRTWSLGINAGMLAPMVATGGQNDYGKWQPDLGYGLTLRKQFGHSFGVELAGIRGTLQGEKYEKSTQPLPTFKTDLNYAASLSAVFNVATIDFLRRENNVNFIVKAGYGIAGYMPEIWKPAGAIGHSVEDRHPPKKNVKEQFFPVGLGAKFKLSDRVNFDLGYNMYFLDGDNLDAYYGAPPSEDKWSYTYVGFEFSLGSSAKPNLDWVNPVASLQDDYISRNAALQAELAADRAKHAAHMAQMDTDWKRFLNDADKDGVSDYFDKCPNTPAGTQVDGAGCEIKVTNTTVNPVRVVVTEEDRRVVAEAIRNLEFDFAKSSIRPSSYPSLNRVADLLKTKDFSLKLAGHTDYVGSDAANLKLSKDRAESVKSYLVSHGANPSRIEATGYGETQPISSNSTAAGRQNNRRVEFTLY